MFKQPFDSLRTESHGFKQRHRRAVIFNFGFKGHPALTLGRMHDLYRKAQEFSVRNRNRFSLMAKADEAGMFVMPGDKMPRSACTDVLLNFGGQGMAGRCRRRERQRKAGAEGKCLNAHHRSRAEVPIRRRKGMGTACASDVLPYLPQHEVGAFALVLAPFP